MSSRFWFAAILIFAVASAWLSVSLFAAEPNVLLIIEATASIFG